jgi:hypothetical protein
LNKRLKNRKAPTYFDRVGSVFVFVGTALPVVLGRSAMRNWFNHMIIQMNKTLLADPFNGIRPLVNADLFDDCF